MDLSDLRSFTSRKWDQDLIPRLVDYVRVPAKSPGFDASWAAHGHLQAVIQSAEQWCRAQPIAGMTLEIVSIDGLTPCLFFDIPATGGLGNDTSVLASCTAVAVPTMATRCMRLSPSSRPSTRRRCRARAAWV